MEGVAPQTNAHGFQRYYLIWGNIAKVYIAAKQLEEVKLLRFLRSLPNNLFTRDLG